MHSLTPIITAVLLPDIINRLVAIIVLGALFVFVDQVREQLHDRRHLHFAGHRRPREIPSWILSRFMPTQKKKGDQ